MNESARSCFSCVYWDQELRPPDAPAEAREGATPLPAPGSADQGKCRRHPPVLILSAAGVEPNRPATLWPLTLPQDWCGEFQPRHAFPMAEEPPIDPEEERALRNASIAQALMVLPAEKRDRLLIAVLTEEERECPTPPDDFYDRVQDYLARQRAEGAPEETPADE